VTLDNGKLAEFLARHEVTIAKFSDELASLRDVVGRSGSRWLSVDEAARHLGVSRATVFKLAGEGRLNVSRPTPGTTRFDREELDRYMVGAARRRRGVRGGAV
jgi:excisionase family DNA binding protein